MFTPESSLQRQPSKELKIGANLGSFLPYIMLDQVASTTAELRQRGFNFVSTLPMRNTDKTSVLPIWFVEDAWNPTEAAGMAGLLEVARGKINQDAIAPQLQDWVAFPDKETSGQSFRKLLVDNPDATVIAHHADDAFFPRNLRGLNAKTLLEIHPGMMDILGQRLTVPQLRRYLDNSARFGFRALSGVVFDTKHARRVERPDELAKISLPNQATSSAFGNYREVLTAVGPDIKLIDFQALNPQELQDTLNHKSTELADMMEELVTTHPGVPIRMEIQLSMARQLIPGSVMTQMDEAAQFIREIHARQNGM